MKFALKEKEQKVKKLRGTKPISDIAVNTLSKVTLEKPSVTKAKAKTGKTTLSPVKAELKSSEIKIHSSSVKPSIKSDDAIDVSTLRNDKKLRKSVRKELRSLGLKVVDLNSDTSSSSVDSSSTSDSDSETSDSMHTCKCSKKKKHKNKRHSKTKSGIKAKSSDKVKAPQKWPHAHLQYEFVNKKMKFDDLDYRLFIAGELEIISESRQNKCVEENHLL